MRSADVVIIGAGVIGASVAYHLASRGCRNVIVLDQNSRPGEGSTLKATGGFRCQFGTDINVRISLLSRQKLRSFRDELGIDSGYRACGYLFVALQEPTMNALILAQKIQKEAGLVEVEQLNREQVHSINPAVDPNLIFGGVYCSTDGFIRASQILKGYIEAAEGSGVQFEYGSRLERFHKTQNRIDQAETSNGLIAAGAVVNAAGPWASLIAERAGFSIPVQAVRRQAAVLQGIGLLPEEMPMTIFADDAHHFRVRDGLTLILWPDPAQAAGFDTNVTEDWINEVKKRTDARIPCLRNIPIDREKCWAGLYEMSPDKHALLGASPEIENFYLINGSSGHGVMHAPALGQLLAEIILDGHASTLDVHALRPSRFAEGQPIVGPQLL